MGSSALKPLLLPSVNYALNRPALQSSVSEWSRSKKPDEAARGANDGDLTRPFGCHTSEEDRPWWQVDLGIETTLDRVVIYNRQECAYRLRHFSLYASLDGKDWYRFHKKTDSRIFGIRADEAFAVVPRSNVIARFIRLQLDCRETLHFKECEVYGHPPTQEEHEQFARQDGPAVLNESLVAGRSGFIAQLDQHSIFVDEVNYAPKIVNALRKGAYEQEERQFAEKMLDPSDRVLEAGTAIGVVSMVAAERTSPEQVRTFDGNPHIIEDAKRNFAFNQMAGINAKAGILKNRKHLKPLEKTIKFTIVRDFWASRLDVTNPAGVVEVVDVPVFCLEDEIASHQANVLIIDIEGGEIDLLRGADLSPIRLIIMETHYWAAGVDATDAMIRELIEQGFNINLELSRWGVVVLRREMGWRKSLTLRPRLAFPWFKNSRRPYR